MRALAALLAAGVLVGCGSPAPAKPPAASPPPTSSAPSGGGSQSAASTPSASTGSGTAAPQQATGGSTAAPASSGGSVTPSNTAPTPTAQTVAISGAAIFQAECQKCHGAGGAGGSGPALNGGVVQQSFPTVSALEAFIKQNMPADKPGTLTAAQAQAAAEYVWSLHK